MADVVNDINMIEQLHEIVVRIYSIQFNREKKTVGRYDQSNMTQIQINIDS
jgi:hypothetical protein